MQKAAASVGVLALAALLGWTGYAIVNRQAPDAFAACRSGNIAGGPIGGPFELVDETGKTVTDAELLTQPALIYFGFASCADVCPLDNARNVEAAQILARQGITLRPIFISVDPKRDTPDVLTTYTDAFGPELLGLTGTPEQIKAAANAYKTIFEIPQDAGDDYEVSHMTLSYLMLPGGQFGDFYQRETTAQEIADRAGCFLRAGQDAN